MKITKTSKTITVTNAEYHPAFIARARKIAGQYEKATDAWTFDIRDEGTVRANCLLVYGEDGITTPELCDVQIVIENETSDQVFRYGRKIASRYGRDSNVKLGTKVVIISGAFPQSAGSTKYPALQREGSPVTLEVRDVPASLVDDECTVVRRTPTPTPAEPTPAEPTPAEPTPAEPTPAKTAQLYDADLTKERPFEGLTDEQLAEVIALLREEERIRRRVSTGA